MVRHGSDVRELPGGYEDKHIEESPDLIRSRPTQASGNHGATMGNELTRNEPGNAKRAALTALKSHENGQEHMRVVEKKNSRSSSSHDSFNFVNKKNGRTGMMDTPLQAKPRIQGDVRNKTDEALHEEQEVRRSRTGQKHEVSAPDVIMGEAGTHSLKAKDRHSVHTNRGGIEAKDGACGANIGGGGARESGARWNTQGSAQGLSKR